MLYGVTAGASKPVSGRDKRWILDEDVWHATPFSLIWEDVLRAEPSTVRRAIVGETSVGKRRSLRRTAIAVIFPLRDTPG